MKGINCFLSNALTRRWAIKYKLPEAIILKIQQTAEAETKPDGITTEKFIEQKIENYIERLNGSTAQRTAVPHYTGDVNPEENTIFVFGSNPTGYHGAGAAKDAANRFGAVYGQGEGLQGSAYALPTKRIDKKPEGITDIVAPMTFSFDGKQRLGVMSSTTFEAIINGERTATTRYLTGDEKSRKHIDALSRAKVGDIITFTDTDFKGKVYVRVTKPLTLLDEKTDPNEWSQKEGWSTDHFKYVVRPKIEARQAYQLEFEYVGANGERTVTPKEIIKNIQTLYGVAAQHPDKQFKIGYRNVGTFKTLNGYSGRELMLMFLSAGRIPSNVVFSSEWASDPYFSNLYAEIQKDSSESKEKPILKKEFKGKLIFASPSAGKTSIADNVDIIDGDYILANILGVPTALVKDAMDLAYKAGQSVGIANQYAQAIQEYLKAGKTVITARLASLPMAHIIVHRESADDIVEVSNRDRENKGLNSTDAAKVQEKILEEVGKRGSGESVTLSKTQFLGDILLENPSYNLGSLEGKAEQRSQTKSLSNIIAEFLGEFGIAAEICPEISEALDIQIVQKVLTAKSAEDLPAGAGEMIAMMSLWNPKMKRIVAEMIQRDIDAGKIESEYAVLSPTNVVNDVVYKACLKDGQFRKYTSYIGKYMGEILREEYGIRRKKTSTNPSFIDKLLEIIRETIAKLKEHFYFVSELDSTCRTFAKHILANNPYFITSSLCKPGSPDLRVSLMDPRKIFQDYPAERELIYLLDKHNIHIAGSLSMSMQGTVYRPDENPMHDLDFAALFDNQEELEETLLSLEPFKNGKLHHYRTIVDKADKEGHGTYTYFSLSVPFKVEVIDKDNGHLVDVNTGKTLAVYHKSDLTIVEEGVTGKILDFFVKGKEAKTVPFKVDDQHTIQASHWSAAVSAKVDWVRLKDLFDYNRFITYEFLQHKKAVQTKIEKAEQNVKQETAAKLTMSKRQLLYKALDYSIRQYRHKRIAIDFAQKVLQNINDQVRLIDRKIADEQDPETKQTLYEKRARLLGEDKISALFEMVPVSQIFNEIKEEYEFYATPEDEDGADDETLQAIFPSPKGPAYVREQARIIVDHFDALVEESLTTIEEHTGLRLTLEEQITVDNSTSMMVSLVEDENEENQNINVDEDTHVDIGGGTSYKVRNKKNFETMSNKVKDIINSIVKVDASGTPIVDDLGTPQYLSAREVHGMLGDELSSMIESEDFCVKNTEGDEITYSFPALEKVSKKYSWVKQIIERLQKRPALIGAFYGVFRKDFIKRFIYKAGKGIIPVNETSVFGSAWKELNERLDSGTPVSPKSVYDASGVNKDKFEKSIKTIDAIIDDVDTASELSTAEVRKLTKKIVDAFSIVGLKVNEGPLKDMLADSDLKKNIKDSLQKSKQIIEALSKTSEEHIPSMMTSKTRPFYINILRALNIANDGHAELTYRQGGESRTSYTVPGYIETMVKKLKTFKGEALEEFLASEFKEVRGPFYRHGEHGRWLNTILGSLANTRTRAAVQSNLDAAELTHIDGVEYESWTSEHITKGFIGMFLEGDFTDGDTSTRADYVWYHAPILSDSPVVKFIKLKRYKKPIDKTLREHMLPLFRDVVKQELMRMQHVEERAEGIKNGTIKPIANYDGKRGSSFCYFTEFNKPDLKDALLQAHKAKDTTKLNKIIDENLSKILDNEFEFWLRASGALYSEDVKRIFSAKGYDVSTEEKYRECLEDYYLNQSYASSQIIQILTTDPAFYKNGVEFQKRFKEVYAAGTKLNTQTRLGKKTQKVLYLKDKSGSSRVTSMIQKVLDRAVEQGYILPMDRDNILHKLDGYCATDGQAFRTLDSLKSIFDMMGILEEVEPAIDRIASGKWQMDDFYIVFQTLKPFYYNSIVENDGVGGKIRVGHQHKDSEFIPLLYETIAMGLNTDTEMQALQDFMVKHEIDAAVFESGVKTGGSFTIDIFKNERVDRAIADKTILIGNKTYQFSDKVETLEHLQSEIQQKIVSKEITQEEANAILDYLASTYDDVKAILEDNVFTTDEQGQTVLNTNAVKECPMEGYSIAMSTSANHLTDSETIYGTQFNSLITADLPKDFEVTLGGKKYDRVSIKKLYQDVKIENLLDNFESVRHIFGSPEQLVKEIIKRIDSNSKYNKGIKEAIKLVQKKDPTTGRMITTFKIPLINPTMKDQLQEVVLSIFKNKITKQKIKGGTAFLVSDVGFTKELKIKYKTDKQGRTSIDYIPCYLPCWCKEMFKDVLRKRTSLKGVEYWELDIDAKDENGNYIIDRKLLDMVGYRIPTEHKYSMVPLRVVGFLPQQNGSSIMLPAEPVVIFSGADYDIDKLFLMMYEYKKLKYDIPQAKADYTDMQISDVPFSKWLEQHKDKYTLKTPLYRKIEYDYSVSPEENTTAQRNNALIDISRAVLTSPSIADQVHKPQGFDSFIRGAAITRIVENSNIISSIKRIYGLKTHSEVASFILKASTKTLQKLLEDFQEEVPLLSPRNFLYYHSQNTAGGNSLGAYANNTTAHTKYQGTGIASKVGFTFNERFISALDGMYTEQEDHNTGETARTLITQNCCMGVGASADNAKQPTISDMRQAGGLIKLSGYLMRSGLPMEDVALFFAQPMIANHIDTNGTLTGIEESLGEHYYQYIKTVDMKNYRITSQELLELMVMGNNIEDLSEAETQDYYKRAYPVVKLIADLWKAANALGVITRVSRSDSTNGAIAHNLGLALSQLYLTDAVEYCSSKEEYPLINLSAVPRNIGSSYAMASKENLRQRFQKSGNPMLQAFHSLGIELPIYMLQEYFAEASPTMADKLAQVTGDATSMTLSDSLASSLLSHYVVYRLGTYPLFRSKGDLISTREYYLKEFPNELMRILKENPDDIGKNEFLQKLSVIKKGKRRVLQITDANLITETEAARLGSALDELLYMDNPIAQELAQKLFAYSYFAYSLSYLPHGLTRFFSTEFLEAMPGYIDKLRDIETDAREGRGFDRYVEYWRNNTLSEKALKSYTSKQITKETIDDDVIYVASSTLNLVGDWRRYIKYKEQDLLGNVTWRLLELDGFLGTEKAVYREIPSMSSLSFYNPDMSVEDTIQIIREIQEREAALAAIETEKAAFLAGAIGNVEGQISDQASDEGLPNEYWEALAGNSSSKVRPEDLPDALPNDLWQAIEGKSRDDASESDQPDFLLGAYSAMEASPTTTLESDYPADEETIQELCATQK